MYDAILDLAKLIVFLTLTILDVDDDYHHRHMWALSAQLSIAQSDQAANGDARYPTCAWMNFEIEQKLNVSRSRSLSVCLCPRFPFQSMMQLSLTKNNIDGMSTNVVLHRRERGEKQGTLRRVLKKEEREREGEREGNEERLG